jgi:cytochrome c553
MRARIRRLSIAVGVVGVISGIAAVVVALAGSASSDTGRGPAGAFNPRTVLELPSWIHQEHLPPAALPGAKLFAVAGCTTCHTYAGTGTPSFHAPDLTAAGSRHRGIAFEIRLLGCPSCIDPRSPMPGYAVMGTRRLHQLAVFLEDSKGLR